MSILETQRDLDNHTPLSQIPSFSRAYLIPPTSSAKSNRPEGNREFSDNRPRSTEHEDITHGESCQKSLDQDPQSQDDSDGLQEVDSEEQDIVQYTSQLKRTKRSNIYGTHGSWYLLL